MKRESNETDIRYPSQMHVGQQPITLGYRVRTI
jgi:hypothetical protein